MNCGYGADIHITIMISSLPLLSTFRSLFSFYPIYKLLFCVRSIHLNVEHSRIDIVAHGTIADAYPCVVTISSGKDEVLATRDSYEDQSLPKLL
jgi:hypothetical protein